MRKNSPKKLFNRGKKSGRNYQEEQQRRDPSPRTDRHALKKTTVTIISQGIQFDDRNVDCKTKMKRMDPRRHRATSGVAQIGRTCCTPPPLHHGDLEEDRPHKHMRNKHSIHTDRDMKTCKLGGEGRRGWISWGTMIKIHVSMRHRQPGEREVPGQPMVQQREPEWERGGGGEGWGGRGREKRGGGGHAQLGGLWETETKTAEV